jgi:peroxidase
MKPMKNRSAERLETRNLLAADVGFNENLFLPSPPDAEFGPPAVVDQAGPFRRGAPLRRPDGQLPPRPGSPPLSETEPIEARNIDGTENNLGDPTLVSVDTPLLRTTAVEYADGISEPAGEDRPSARDVSNAVAAQITTETNDRYLTDITWLWGQFIDHDIDLTENADPAESFDIEVPTGDEYFDPDGTGEAVISVNRSVYDTRTGTSTADPREQINQITAFIDGSVIYGSDEERAAELRSFEGGLLAMSEGDLLPFNEAGLENAGGTSDTLFLAGDVRANENAALTAMQTLWVREHNYWAGKLAAENPSLSDEELYQEAKAIVTAELQAITYNEYLPALLGEGAVSDYHGYDSSVDPSISNIFSTASYRYGHSALSSELLRLNNDGTTADEGNLALLDAFFAPGEIIDNGIDSLLLGVTAQVANEIDTQIVDDVRNFLFGEPGNGGFDLAALNIQRGRDHGLADYNQVREDLGLERVTDFSEITSNPELAAKLEDLYGDVDNIDAWVGSLAEDHVAGSSMGELNQIVIVDQFERLRDGDRLWYENVFSGQELAEIENTTLSDVIERNTDITGLRENVFYDDSVLRFDLADQGVTSDVILVVDDSQVEMVDARSSEVLESRAVDEISQIQIVGSDRVAEHVTIDLSATEAEIPGGIVVNGGTDLGNIVDLFGADDVNAVTVDGNQVTVNGTTIEYANIDLVRWHSGSADDTLATFADGDAQFVVVDDATQHPVQMPDGPRDMRGPRGTRTHLAQATPTDAVDEVFTELGESELATPLDRQLVARRNQRRGRR